MDVRFTESILGGARGNRTPVQSFAGFCLTTRPSRPIQHLISIKAIVETKREAIGLPFNDLERETRLELATSTLARLRSTS